METEKVRIEQINRKIQANEYKVQGLVTGKQQTAEQIYTKQASWSQAELTRTLSVVDRLVVSVSDLQGKKNRVE